MNGRDEENLKELFEKFVSGNEAERAAEDIQKGDEILRQRPGALPDEQLLADIKTRMAVGLQRRKKATFRKVVYGAAAVAAVIIFAAISVRPFEDRGAGPERIIAAKIPEAIWESEDIAADDAVLAGEIEQAEREVLALRLGENGGNGGSLIAELEMELIEIGNDFWKG